MTPKRIISDQPLKEDAVGDSLSSEVLQQEILNCHELPDECADTAAPTESNHELAPDLMMIALITSDFFFVILVLDPFVQILLSLRS
jgi:hypothetical protein